MKIFHIITLSSLGGAQSVVSNLANSQSINNDVYIVSGAGGNAWKALPPAVNIITIPQLKRKISLLDIIVLFKLIYLRVKFNPDIIHLHSSKTGMLGRFVFSKKRTVYTIHGFDSIRIANRNLLFVEKLLKNKAAKLVCVSDYDVFNLQKYGITKKVTCIHNGTEDKLMISSNKLDEIVKNKFKEIRCIYAKIVLCIARDDKQKNTDLFFEIALKLPEVAFVWIGNQHQYKSIPKNVFLFGIIESASLYLRFADLFILTSNYEGLPMSIIEAMSFGKPVVASNVGGISELLDGDNGVVVDNNSNVFATKINMILSDTGLMERMGNYARNIYLKDFTVEVMVNGYDEIYKEILNKNN